MRVSVITPFFNTAMYLEQCIESVLAQTLTDFEYLLVDNRSTDGSRDIAATYAKADSRVRLIDNPAHVGQVENYNGALAQISPEATWVKLIQADDALYPECLERTVEVGERDSRIGLVGALYMKGDEPHGAGIPLGVEQMSGREVCRRMLLGNCFPIGSPSAVLYRADLVRQRAPFFALDRYHEDTEAAYELLLNHDFGFVHQVLVFQRTDNSSIMATARRFNPDPLDHLIALERYGPQVLSADEYGRQHHNEWRAYMGFLGESVLRRREAAFWAYHRAGLSQQGHELGWRQLLPAAARATAHLALLPLSTVRRWRSESGRPPRLRRRATAASSR
jgi:glycosyltransferase involved in cell wall biosynthesis